MPGMYHLLATGIAHLLYGRSRQPTLDSFQMFAVIIPPYLRPFVRSTLYDHHDGIQTNHVNVQLCQPETFRQDRVCRTFRHSGVR